MMNRVLKVVAGTMMVAGLFVSNVQAKEVSETGNNVLKAGRIVVFRESGEYRLERVAG